MSGKRQALVLCVCGWFMLTQVALVAVGAGGPTTVGDELSAEELAGISVSVIDSPPWPPVSAQRSVITAMPQSAVMLSNVPTSQWTYGCSATAAGMLFGYYDRTGYANMYTGPTNGGVAPLTNLGQGIGSNPISGSCSLIATEYGFDGRNNYGHVDDYWIGLDATGPDPWEGSRAEHTWGECTADFLGTSQWKWDTDENGARENNYDGATLVYTYSDGTKLYDFEPPSSYGLPRTAFCHGLRLFAESRGYDVVENYSQPVDARIAGGFSFANYTSEINAGRPVFIHLAGHTTLGVGYEAASQTVYLHDTWDNSVHAMTWGMSYAGMSHQSVTVIRLEQVQSEGGLMVTLYPEAVRAVARWRLTSGPDTSWKQSGATITGLMAGNYTLEFSEVPDWRAPMDRVIAIYPGANSAEGTYSDADAVVFDDPDLEEAVEAELGVLDPTEEDMAYLVELDATSGEIDDLTGLEFAVNLEVLILVDNAISDVGPLAGLTSLEYLYLNFNQVSNIAPLAGLTGLVELGLWHNQVASVAPLAGLTGLRHLDLEDNQISNVVPLAGLTGLETLYLGVNPVSDISALSTLSNLLHLLVYGAQLGDLDGVEGMVNLEYLDASDNLISDLTPLAGLSWLYYLDLSGNAISDAGPLAGLTGLEDLDLSENSVTDLTALEGLVDLVYLGLASNGLSDLTSLAGLVNLNYFVLDHNAIADLTPLAGMVALIELTLQDNQVSDIGPLAGLTAMELLVLWQNQVSDLGPLGGMVNLYYLDLEDNQVSDISVLAGLSSLETLWLISNPLNTPAYCTDVPAIRGNNPGVKLYVDDNPNPMTQDCRTDLGDLLLFSSRWLESGCETGNDWCTYADLDHRDDVNLADYAEFVALWSTAPPLVFEEGFETGDFSAHAWEFDGDAAWTVDFAEAGEGIFSARSGAIGHYQSSTLQVAVGDEVRSVSFLARISSESGWDFLRFYVDGMHMRSWSGSVDWQRYTFPVGPGAHTYTWTYSKDGSVSSYSDCVWIDQIEME